MTLPGATHQSVALELTPAQRRIVDWDEGPLVVIAGAGTGKTRVTVERVAVLRSLEVDVERSARLGGRQVLVVRLPQ
jgi:superfamily I DNA/RNA helicase